MSKDNSEVYFIVFPICYNNACGEIMQFDVAVTLYCSVDIFCHFLAYSQ